MDPMDPMDGVAAADTAAEVDVDLTQTSTVADLFAAARPRLLDRAGLLALDELELARSPSAAGTWLAPFSPSVCGMVISDVVLDGLLLGNNMHPVVRWVYDTETDVAHAASVSRDGALVTAASVRPAEDGGGLVISGCMMRRPTTPDGDVQLLIRTSTLLQRTEPFPPRDTSSPLAAYRDSVIRLVGTFGSAAVLAGLGDGTPACQDPSRAPDLVTTTVFNEFASASVVQRLQAKVLGQIAVHPGGLRLGPPAPGGRAVAIAPSPPGTLICASASEETPCGSWLSAMGSGLEAGAAEAPKGRTRAKVHLEDVADEAARARIVRNREAARRSNAKRRERRRLALSGS
ncbi:hypothetical protein I4F81_004717 [Pyropia yezoensis]|uniref:Uncharacterized protein n=1 Tax=Pyropia yezoensis TaxID=2788 RepID=A0ACC3BVR9_PYRYE|nr:hypothetical protein I4F81_004717 [Neopyropia yezoensis]